MNVPSATLPRADESPAFSAPIAMSVEELRNDKRTKTSLSGTIVDKGSSLDCLVRDISEGGAKIEIDATFALAPNFDLVIAATRTLYHCELRWRYARAVGVKFIATEPLAETVEGPTREELLAENLELKRTIASLTGQLAEIAASQKGKAAPARSPKNTTDKIDAPAKKSATPRRAKVTKDSKPLTV